MERAVAEFRDHTNVGIGIDPRPGRNARVPRLLAEGEDGRERDRILIDDERQLDAASLVPFRQFGQKRLWHQRRIVGARGRLELDQALVLYDRSIVEEQAHEVGPGIRLLVVFSESAAARRTEEREAGESLSSVKCARR